MRYFTLQECIHSDTAKARGIDNTPGAVHEAHIISSGYRGLELNAAVGGSSTSAHCHGYAFDLVPTNGKMREFKRFCREFLADKAFDQLISEGEDENGSMWATSILTECGNAASIYR